MRNGVINITVLVVFGSKSDSAIYDPLCHALKKNKVDFVSKIISAHKTPDALDKALEKDYELIIAGAGLSAALPGVVASKTIRPVIGVPCHVNYEGLDALLSVVQMPSGIPVLAVGVNKIDIVADNAAKILSNHESVSLIGSSKSEILKKAEEVLKKFEVNYTVANTLSKDKVNIVFTHFNEPIEKKDELVIYCPLISPKEDKAEAALNLLKHSDHGLWVGLNNATNAALAAIEIINHDKRYDQALKNYRGRMKKGVLEANK
jgi:5-(carboxyamino)imidazole ribonucleotide mutase